MAKKTDLDNRANQLNPNNSAYHKSRGVEPPFPSGPATPTTPQRPAAETPKKG